MLCYLLTSEILTKEKNYGPMFYGLNKSQNAVSSDWQEGGAYQLVIT